MEYTRKCFPIGTWVTITDKRVVNGVDVDKAFKVIGYDVNAGDDPVLILGGFISRYGYNIASPFDAEISIQYIRNEKISSILND